MLGTFEGDLHVAMLDNGRLIRLLKPFAYRDGLGVRWPVPKGLESDGASIPRFLWSFLGGPLDGRYRKAAIIHDYYCDVRLRSWQAVHLMFYEAMLAAHVPARQAKVLYFGVRLGGPRWTETATKSTLLPIPAGIKVLGNNGPRERLEGGTGTIRADLKTERIPPIAKSRLAPATRSADRQLDEEWVMKHADAYHANVFRRLASHVTSNISVQDIDRLADASYVPSVDAVTDAFRSDFG